jgi:hypothetical protein
MAMACPSPELFVVPPLRRTLRSEQAPDPLRDQLAAVVERSALEMLDPALIAARAEDMRPLKTRRHSRGTGTPMVRRTARSLCRSTRRVESGGQGCALACRSPPGQSLAA